MIDKLIDQIIAKKSPIVVGLDPRPDLVPGHIMETALDTHGQTPKAIAHAYLEFNKGIIDAVADLIPAVKPQIAMYENYGMDGLWAYLETVNYAKEKGLVVIGDVKRSDIASTALAYADGHIGQVSIGENTYPMFNADFITVNPYLGSDSIEPFKKNCEKFDKGLFVLVKTSNAGSGELQDLKSDGKFIYEIVGDLVSKWGESLIGSHGYSKIGAVVGATHPEQAAVLRKQMPHSFFLVPGYGAQGATAKDLACCFDKNGLGAIVNSSRGIIGAHKSGSFDSKDFGQAAREAVIAMKSDLGGFLQ